VPKPFGPIKAAGVKREKGRPGNGNGLQPQTLIHAVRLFWALQRRAALGAAARGVVVTPPVLGS